MLQFKKSRNFIFITAQCPTKKERRNTKKVMSIAIGSSTFLDKNFISVATYMFTVCECHCSTCVTIKSDMRTIYVQRMMNMAWLNTFG